jgi:predicted kinase
MIHRCIILLILQCCIRALSFTSSNLSFQPAKVESSVQPLKMSAIINNDPPWFVEAKAAISAGQILKSKEPAIIVLVGIPGSGKSTFAAALVDVAPHLYVRVNQDDLGSRDACISFAKEMLWKGKSPVIDRCNFDKAQRKHWIQIARDANVRAHYVYLCVDQETCLDRCLKRRNHPTLPARKAHGVVTDMFKKLVEPNVKEGFADGKRLVTFQNYMDYFLSLVLE